MWQSYFGPEAEIHGIDINPAALRHAPPGASVHIGSQDDEQFLSRVMEEHGRFDIVIDDGSHMMEHQITTFNTVYPTLSDNGLYICEDSFTSYWKEYGGELGGMSTFMEHAKRLVDELHAYWATDAGLEPTQFTTMTQGIHIYSGTVVFQRKPVDRPMYVVRHQDTLSEMSIAELKIAAGK